MVGSALVRKFKKKGYKNLLLRTHQELDLLNQKAVFDFLKQEKSDYIIIAAAKVGGIMANNTYRAQFIYENLVIVTNIIHGAHLADVNNLLLLGSSCIYPRDCPQPMKEEYLLTGPLEPTNEPYAIAKIAGIKMCENYYRQYGRNYFSVMPTNLYGPNDNFNLQTSHVLPALIRKFHLAKCLENNDWDSIRNDLSKRPIENINGKSAREDIIKILTKYGISLIRNPRSKFRNSSNIRLTLWGSGTPRREFLHVDDLADAVFFLIHHTTAEGINPQGVSHINIGTGKDLTIKELAETIKNIVGFKGEIEWDNSKPDGTRRKLMDVSKLKGKGWSPSLSLEIEIQNICKAKNS